MVRLLPVNHRTLVKGLLMLGFDGPFSGGKHLYMERGDLTLTIPNPHSGDIGPELLSRILRQAGVSKEEWEKAKE
ncbi:MAG: type II toxin-antitoxin system HicA family toxin [Nitrospirae bacterium]|nr:type II toxin-antitoxin system HicA family toxin [Nitrospirota bacterium]